MNRLHDKENFFRYVFFRLYTKDSFHKVSKLDNPDLGAIDLSLGWDTLLILIDTTKKQFNLVNTTNRIIRFKSTLWKFFIIYLYYFILALSFYNFIIFIYKEIIYNMKNPNLSILLSISYFLISKIITITQQLSLIFM